MLAQRHRFHGRTGLRAVYSRGEGVRAGLMSARFLRRDSSKPYRVAIVVSRKVHKSAVKRNRIRRRIYEAVRLQEQLLPAGTDLVITVFNDQLATMEAPKLQELTRSLLEKVAHATPKTAASHAIVKPDISSEGTKT